MPNLGEKFITAQKLDTIVGDKKLSDDNTQRLQETLKRSENLEEEVKELRTQVLSLMTVICTDLICQLRRELDDRLANIEEKLNIKR